MAPSVGRRHLDPAHHVLHLADLRAGVHGHRAAQGAGDAGDELAADEAALLGALDEAARGRAGREDQSPRPPPRRSRATAPRTPRSETSRLAPPPSTVTGTERRRQAPSNAERSAASAGRPPTRMAVRGASGASRRHSPRRRVSEWLRVTREVGRGDRRDLRRPGGGDGIRQGVRKVNINSNVRLAMSGATRPGRGPGACLSSTLTMTPSHSHWGPTPGLTAACLVEAEAGVRRFSRRHLPRPSRTGRRRWFNTGLAARVRQVV